MSIVRVAERPRYLVMDKAAIEDSRLSWKARGLLAYLLSKPDDWQVRTEHLITTAPDGRTAVLSGLRELEDAGYIRRERVRNDRGHLTDWQLLVYERPAQKPGDRQAENLTVGATGNDANETNTPTDEPKTRPSGYRRPTEPTQGTDSPPPTGEDSPQARARPSGGEKTRQELPPAVEALLAHPRLQADERCRELTAEDCDLVEQLGKELERPGVTPALLAGALAAATRGTIAEAAKPHKALAWRLDTKHVRDCLDHAERAEQARQERLARQRRSPALPPGKADWDRLGGRPSELLSRQLARRLAGGTQEDSRAS